MKRAVFQEAVYRLVRDIPRGKVMTYGQIATILGHPRAARAVGTAMRLCGGVQPVPPWHRVINSRGRISLGGDPGRPLVQRQLLEEEGVVFDASDTCNLRVYRWEPARPAEYAIELSRELPF